VTARIYIRCFPSADLPGHHKWISARVSPLNHGTLRWFKKLERVGESEWSSYAGTEIRLCSGRVHFHITILRESVGVEHEREITGAVVTNNFPNIRLRHSMLARRDKHGWTEGLEVLVATVRVRPCEKWKEKQRTTAVVK
jgi:hypothetical protein